MASNWFKLGQGNHPEMESSPNNADMANSSNQYTTDEIKDVPTSHLSPEEQATMVEALQSMEITSVVQGTQTEHTENNQIMTRPRASSMEHTSVDDHHRALQSREMAYTSSLYRSRSMSELRGTDEEPQILLSAPGFNALSTHDASDVEMGDFCSCCK
ncbi:hypothetical protein ASPWEDRAFT_173761 [Aspergillus wentii DTO 134E9]|uniref:Uncharacterized protein n=1 Tax=Aspergillus wentii DTO 134E9 TaxID=1073089 RepID=A0A1L9RHE3_ASPWE|nr:uncharacterized protein ASPWEDRAFT_173761 [Aspergillus wentii DTO 134E9]KAI9925678.1 hypothetical protein MW887_005477 [Aspergillus wentii]OJJ34342.1 hypothetical protein ASPWEDRAFT_173761 [Aspergillus wentii DTO 134E9]